MLEVGLPAAYAFMPEWYLRFVRMLDLVFFLQLSLFSIPPFGKGRNFIF